MRLLAGMPFLFLRCMLALSLVFTPLGHVLGGADLSAPTQQAGMDCHSHDAHQPAQGGCCHDPGGQCHCATAAALPARGLSGFKAPHAMPPPAWPSFYLQAYSVPEIPPPRA